MKLLQTVTLSATNSVIAVSNIPQTYSDLLVTYSLRSAVTASSSVDVKATFNGSGSMLWRGLYSNRGSLGSNTFTDTSPYAYPAAGSVPSNDTANTFSNGQMYISNYTSSSIKAVSMESSAETNSASGSVIIQGSWVSNGTGITSISLSDTSASQLQVGSTMSVYGINPIPTASLGAPTAVDYLVVAGGGSGNQGYINAPGLAGGGGGAGGMLTGTALGVSAGTAITVTVGAGGAFVANLTNSAANGNNSAFSTVTATGGGGGGMQSRQGANGGSGGGGGGNNSGAGTGIAGQGYAGGSGNNYPGDNPSGDGKAGGGGGAGGVGTNNAGGPGVVSTIDGFSKTYAKGGDGALYNGGAGAAVPAGTGYGGNGGGGTNAGSSGASGIVIIRYPQTYTAPTAVTGNPAVNYINGYRVYTWYNSGSITF